MCNQKCSRTQINKNCNILVPLTKPKKFVDKVSNIHLSYAWHLRNVWLLWWGGQKSKRTKGWVQVFDEFQDDSCTHFKMSNFCINFLFFSIFRKISILYPNFQWKINLASTISSQDICILIDFGEKSSIFCKIMRKIGLYQKFRWKKTKFLLKILGKNYF